MTDPENTDTAVIDRELTAIDSALDAGATTASDPYELELQELALALADDSPHPAPPFGAELSRKVSEGFPRERRLPRFKLKRPPMPLLAGAASVLVALAVAGVLVSGGSDEPMVDALKSSTPREEAAQPGPGDASLGAQSKGSDTTGALSPAPLPPDVSAELDRQGADFAPGRTQRIERSAALTLAAPGDELDKVADGINTVTNRHDGFILRSNLTTGDEGTTGGSFELRIPAARLQAALADLAKLGDVRSRSQAGQDVTRQYANTADRLQAARAQRRSLLRRLENATTDQQTEALRRRLDANAGEIRTLRGQIRDLRLRTDYAKVSVALEEGKGGSGGTGGSGSKDGLGGAVDDALGSLGDSVEILIRTLGVAIPVGLVLLGFTFGGRALRRRRREAALS